MLSASKSSLHWIAKLCDPWGEDRQNRRKLIAIVAPMPYCSGIETTSHLAGARAAQVDLAGRLAKVAHGFAPIHAREAAKHAGSGIEIGNKVFVAEVENIERKLLPADIRKRHCRRIEPGAILELEEFNAVRRAIEMTAKTAQHHVARIADRDRKSVV